MARDLALFREESPEAVTRRRRRRVDRSTAQALAAALSALAIASVVVSASARALVQDGTSVSSGVRTGTITLADDDGGRSLIEVDAMAPGRPVTECIEVMYTGTVLPVRLGLDASSVGDVAEYVHVTIEQGAVGGFDDCSDFSADELTFDGLLRDLVAAPLDVGIVLNQDEATTFRVRLDLLDDAEAAGRSGTIDFVWEAVPA